MLAVAMGAPFPLLSHTELKNPSVESLPWLPSLQPKKLLQNDADQQDQDQDKEEQPAIDLKASPAAKFLLHSEHPPSPLPLSTIPAASVPFLWEDFPGQPKPPLLPSPFPSLPLPPRLACLPPDAKTPEIRDSHPRHKHNSHSWHLLQNFFAAPLRPSSQNEDALEVVGSHSPLLFQQTGTQNHKQTRSSIKSFNSRKHPSFDLPSVPDAVAKEASANDARSKIDYQLPSPYVATIVPLTSPYRDLGPTNDDHTTSSRKCLSTRSSFKYVASIFRRLRGKGLHLQAQGTSSNCFARSNYGAEGNSYLLEDREKRPTSSGVVHRNGWAEERPSFSPKYDAPRFQSPRRGKRTYHSKGRVFCRLRKRSCRLFIATYRAIKRALLLRRGELLGDTKLQPYYTLD